MQMILNELSAKFPVKSQEDAKHLMENFLETCFEIKRMIHNDSILLDQDYKSFELAHGYRIQQWIHDPTVDEKHKKRLRSLLNKSQVYNSEEFEQENSWIFSTEFQYKEYSSKGCLLAYKTDGVAVSFLSNECWRTPEIAGTYTELSDDGDLNQYPVSIPNVSYKENVKIFKEYYEHKKDEWPYTSIKSGQDIVQLADTLYPNLVLCESAVRGCRKNVGVSEARQVYRRLLELQRAAEVMKNTFDKNLLNNATLESEATLKRFSDEHTFQFPDGRIQLFSWHIRYTGGYAGRIFFYPILKEKKIYIGHIGHKLPTVKYH